MVWTRRVLLAGLLGSVLGCQNNTIQLEDDDGTGALDSGGSSNDGVDDGVDDGRPTTSIDMTTSPADTGTRPVVEEGWWLMAIDTTLAPGLPLQYLVQVTEASPGAYNLAFQALSLDVGSTTSPRVPVGDLYSYNYGFALGGGAPLQLYTGAVLVPGAANPITGSDATIDIYIDGMELGDPFCGAVSGSVVSPVQSDLAGSTFATTRLAATDPASLPVDFPVACP